MTGTTLSLVVTVRLSLDSPLDSHSQSVPTDFLRCQGPNIRGVFNPTDRRHGLGELLNLLYLHRHSRDSRYRHKIIGFPYILHGIMFIAILIVRLGSISRAVDAADFELCDLGWAREPNDCETRGWILLHFYHPHTVSSSDLNHAQ